jgi:predicted  nucleic acid-binding Zn-ribbon protein
LIQDTNQTIAGRLDELTSVVTEELNDLVAETHRTTLRIKEYHDYLQELVVLRNESRKSATQAEHLLAETEEGRQKLSDYLLQLEKQVEKEVSGAYKTRRAMIGRIARTIRELGTTHEELKQQLDDALRFKR